VSVLDGLSPARKRFLLGVVALAVAALVAVGAAVYVTQGDEVRPVPQGDLGPVLLVPGYGGGTSGVDVLAGVLRTQGREVTVVDLPGDNTGDLEAQARALDKEAILSMQRAGARSVDVVGYSAGGVVARLWVRDLGGAAVARRVVTLGSPHHGTDLAGLGADIAPDECPEACQQLQPDSELLRRLNAGDETPEGPLWVSIWTTDDQVVVPPSSAELEGALDFTIQSVCPDAAVSHGDLPRDPSVIAAVIRELAPAEPAVPGPGICVSS
jgi:triacylglycerol esterase/lipase EstA (alpha/beta hydrolase family)